MTSKCEARNSWENWVFGKRGPSSSFPSTKCRRYILNGRYAWVVALPTRGAYLRVRLTHSIRVKGKYFSVPFPKLFCKKRWKKEKSTYLHQQNSWPVRDSTRTYPGVPEGTWPTEQHSGAFMVRMVRGGTRWYTVVRGGTRWYVLVCEGSHMYFQVSMCHNNIYIYNIT